MRSRRLLDDADIYIGLEQGEADLAESFVDIGLGKNALVAELRENTVEFICQ